MRNRNLVYFSEPQVEWTLELCNNFFPWGTFHCYNIKSLMLLINIEWNSGLIFELKLASSSMITD